MGVGEDVGDDEDDLRAFCYLVLVPYPNWIWAKWEAYRHVTSREKQKHASG